MVSNNEFEYTGKGCAVPKYVKSVRFHPSVIEVEDNAFKQCIKLRKVAFNDGLKKIGYRAFYYCISLSRITLPSTVTEIGNLAFSGCEQLREVVFNNGLHKIGRKAFSNCKSLPSITYPSTVTEIEQNITMSNSNDVSDELFEYTGEGCVVPKNVTIVRFHPSVVEVEYRAFRGCKQLRVVMFNDGLQKIGRATFYECKSLSSITFPSTVTDIGSYAFSGCEQLREVLLNDGLQKIEWYAFCSCTSLSSITLPSTVTEIGREAFNNCDNLREVIFHGVPRKVGQNAFSNCASLERFTFPTMSTRLDNLIQTGHWAEIENEVDEVRGVVERSGGELFVSTRTMDGGNNWIRVRNDLDKIFRLISYYEIKEGTSIFELALWKFKLDQVDTANPIPRKKCRMDVPGPVKDIILQYLPYECLLPVSDT